ncbi:MAG: biotin/lipoyl-containing protein [Planctomycetota bacterium]
MTTPSPTGRTKATMQQRDGSYWVSAPGVEEPFRVVAWTPPRLLLEHAGEVRAFTVAPGADGAVWLHHDGETRCIAKPDRRGAAGAAAHEGHDDLSAPMPGKVLEVLVAEGDTVEAGQRLVVIEAMKMENPLRAPHHSIVTKIHVGVGDAVAPGDSIIELDQAPAEASAD